MAHLARVPDAWKRARDRFIEDLSEEEKYAYFNATPETILYAASATEKRHRDQSKSRRFIENLQPFVDSVEHYGKALDVFANTYPLVMSPLWGGVRIVLILADEAGQYFERMATMLAQIGEALPRLHVYEGLFPREERLIQALSAVYYDLLEFCYEAKKILRKPKRAMFSTSWKTFERKFGQTIIRFKQHQKTVEKEANAYHMIESADSRSLIRSDQLQRLQEWKENERWQIFAALSSLDYAGQLARLDRLRTKGTCSWLANDPMYIRWRNASTSCGLCCRGIPGSGKSVVMAKFIMDQVDEDAERRKGTLFHFCDYSEPQSLDPAEFYRTLLKQVYVNGLMPETLIEQIVRHYRKSAQSPDERSLARLVLDAVISCGNLDIICDGLDECEESSQRTICDFLRNLASLTNTNVKVLASCREEERPLKYLKQFLQLQFTVESSKSDMAAYIESEVQAVLDRGDLAIQNASLKDDIISSLICKADGMFLWVYIQIIDLCEAMTDQSIRQILENLPRGLDETYQRIVQKAATSLNYIHVQRALHWVACSRRPLKVAELREAAAFETTDKCWDAEKLPHVDKLFQSCHGLLVREQDSSVRFAHHTVRQYLLSPGILHSRSYLSQDVVGNILRFTASEANATVAQMCATYLSFSDFESALVTTEEQRNVTINTVFRKGGPVAIPATLGIDRYKYSIPYRFFGGNSNLKVPNVDFAKFVNKGSGHRQRSPNLDDKYALLDYVREFWPWHTNEEYIPRKGESGHERFVPQISHGFIMHYGMSEDLNDLEFSRLKRRFGTDQSFDSFWKMVWSKETISEFEFRPWGPNQHFGPYGCVGCPPHSSDADMPGLLPGMAALHWAAEVGHWPLIYHAHRDRLFQYLIHERHHQRTLILACRHGHTEIVALLFYAGADLWDRNALHEACEAGNLATLRYMLETMPKSKRLHRARSYDFLSEDYDIRSQAIRLGWQLRGLVHCAAEFGHVHILGYLLETYKDVMELSDNQNKKALHYAAANGQLEAVHFLLNHEDKQSCDYQSVDGETPLMLAVKNGHVRVAEALLARGASLTTRGGDCPSIPDTFMWELLDESKNTTPHYSREIHHPSASDLAVIRGLTEFVEVASQHFEHTSTPSKAYHIPSTHRRINEDSISLALYHIHWAALYGHTGVLAILLQRGADPDERTWPACERDYKFTPLHLATATNQAQVIELLLHHGADPNLFTVSGLAAIHIAAIGNKMRALETLVAKAGRQELETVIDITVRVASPWYDMTALHIAVQKSHIKIVTLLLSAGADPSTRCLHRQPEVKICTMTAAVRHNGVDMGLAKLIYNASKAKSLPKPMTDRALLEDVFQLQSWDAVERLLSLGVRDDKRRLVSDEPVPLALPAGLYAAIDSGLDDIVRGLISYPQLYDQRDEILSRAYSFAKNKLESAPSWKRKSLKSITSMLRH